MYVIEGRILMKKRILCLMLAAVLSLGGGISGFATSSSEVQKQQTETKNKLNKKCKKLKIFKIVTKKKPDTEMVEDMVFAWKIAKHVKSNAVVIEIGRAHV